MSFEIDLYEDESSLWIENFKSSHLIKYIYDGYRCSLIVKYNDGCQYLYAGVPTSVFYRFEMSESKGKFMHQYIRNNYPCTKIDKAQ